MRLGRLVAAGLVAGMVAGFLGALLRPRSLRGYGSPPRPGRGAWGDLAAARGPASGAADAGDGDDEDPEPRRHLDLDALTDPAAGTGIRTPAGVGSASREANG